MFLAIIYAPVLYCFPAFVIFHDIMKFMLKRTQQGTQIVKAIVLDLLLINPPMPTQPCHLILSNVSTGFRN